MLEINNHKKSKNINLKGEKHLEDRCSNNSNRYHKNSSRAVHRSQQITEEVTHNLTILGRSMTIMKMMYRNKSFLPSSKTREVVALGRIWERMRLSKHRI